MAAEGVPITPGSGTVVMSADQESPSNTQRVQRVGKMVYDPHAYEGSGSPGSFWVPEKAAYGLLGLAQATRTTASYDTPSILLGNMRGFGCRLRGTAPADGQLNCKIFYRFGSTADGGGTEVFMVDEYFAAGTAIAKEYLFYPGIPEDNTAARQRFNRPPPWYMNVRIGLGGSASSNFGVVMDFYN